MTLWHVKGGAELLDRVLQKPLSLWWKREAHQAPGERELQAPGKQVQNHGARSMPSLCKERQRGQCGWSSIKEGQSEDETRWQEGRLRRASWVRERPQFSPRMGREHMIRAGKWHRQEQGTKWKMPVKMVAWATGGQERWWRWWRWSHYRCDSKVDRIC